ncbi:putative transcriptional regulator [Gelidibacter algens]|jgi:putative transcriptional regulator|uniref:Putative transcriptional regulator n=1 Tax=Gelidibacter algens TaxID=49280 RepID=A0A1A7QS52_9FLAO|nr:YqgE/AlgH family protein [Gelidibacter algens]OBX22855.1 transcriptional regulator [Gelidibacter algens]RAJ27654.1 putative transcriptional regulator [Gelidibacter algens]
MITIKPKKGHLLIAEPSIIGDTSFNRSVVLLADHTSEGSIGFILNKPLKYNLRDLVPGTKASFKIYNGGPVEQDNLYFIHKVPDLIPESIEISLGIYWGGDFDVVLSLINQGKIKASDIRFFLGYSGWEPFQLEEELETNSWIVTENVYKKSVIEKKDSSFWKEKMLELGGDYSIWSNAPENPSYN